MTPTALMLDACIRKSCGHDQQQLKISDSCPSAVQSSRVSPSGLKVLGGEQAHVLSGASCQLQHPRCAAAFEATVFGVTVLTLVLYLDSIRLLT